MHIKRIAIIGFKSYKDQTFDQPFSAKHNVLVGQNGSGKSNFFNAMLFVLSEKYANLHPTERRELLHATAGTPVLSAYVEITFDNTEGRLVVPGMGDQHEVHIRRTIGIQQDEFRVNDKAMNARDVRQLLEGAGFSAANPYYVVEQGRIVQIANMSEGEKLALLKEVAGTKVYESRRQESLSILEETQSKRDLINQTFEKLQQRSEESSKEASECKQLRAHENIKRKIEFCLYTREAKKLQKEIDVHSGNPKDAAPVDELYRAQGKTEADVQQLEEEMVTCTARIEFLENERTKIDNDRMTLLNKKTRNDVLLSESRHKVSARDSERKKIESEKITLQKEVTRLKKEIEECSSKLLKEQSDFDEVVAKEATLEATQLKLQARRGQSHLFKNAAARDNWLNEEISQNAQLQKKSEAELQLLLDSQKMANKDIAETTSKGEAISSSLLELESRMQSNESERLENIQKRDELSQSRRAIFQKLHASEQSLKEKRSILDRQQTALEKSMGNHDIRDGLRSLKETLEELRKTDKRLADGVYGTVIELFECDDRFHTAVEVTAGNSLFNVVVDTFSTGSEILKYMNAHGKKGRVTFFPLDTCMSKESKIKTTNEVTPLIDYLKFDEKFAPIFKSIFGQTALAASLEVAASVSSSLNCAAITLDGDQINRKGGMRGGFLQNVSRLTSHSKVLRYTEEVAKEFAAYQALRQQLVDAEQEITQVTSGLDAKENANQALRTESHSSRDSLKALRERIDTLYKSLARINDSISSAKSNIEKAKEATKVLTAEKGTPFNTTFKEADEKELEKVHRELLDVQSKVASQTARITALNNQSKILRDTLTTSTQRLDLITEQVSEWTGSGLAVDNQRCSIEDSALQKQLSFLSDRLGSVEAELAKLQKEKQKADLSLHEKRQIMTEARRKYGKALEESTKSRSKLVLLNNQLEEIQVKMRQSGTTNAEVNELSKEPTRRLIDQLKECTAAIANLAHVNTKAVDQLTHTKQKIEELKQKRESNDKELQSIQEMIQKLDEQKDEAIQRTVKQVQHNFEKVFLELVTAQGASASLILVESGDQGSVDSYEGIRIQVCFGLGLPVVDLNQLSGGQRSLVALALIFAIQRCDPAPFYLFDEIDAALDPTYRSSVAAMIRRQSETAQFITASFKEEMLDSADKIYGIVFRNRVSRIQTIHIDEARALLRQEVLQPHDSADN